MSLSTLCCETQLCAPLLGSHAIPHEDRFLHHVVVLHAKSERRANIIGTSPSYVHGMVVLFFVCNFVRQQWQAHFPSTDPHEPRCSDFVSHSDFTRHSSRSEDEARNLGLPCTHLVDHVSTPRPVDTGVHYCAVHMTVHPFAFGRHGDSIGTVDLLVSSPASQVVRSAHWNPFPSRWKRYPSTSETAQKKILNFVPASKT